MQINTFESRDALTEALEVAMAGAVESAVSDGRRASLVVPGGSSPAPVFEKLSSRSLPWQEVDVTLTDERWVSTDDAASNQRMLASTLLSGPASDARFVPLFGDESSPEEGVDAASERIATIGKPFDVVLLGMGLDGHTASLFPDMQTLDEGLADDAAACVAARPESQPMARISLSAPVLSNTRELWLLITGKDKRAVLEAGMDAALPPPIVSVLRRHQSPVIWWAD